MLTVIATALFACAGLAALGVIASSMRRAVPAIAALKGELAQCNDRYELRFRLIETVTVFDDGKVVRLPLRPRQVLPAGLRAAA